MKLYLKKIDNIETTDFLIKDPLLCSMSLSDESLKDLDKGMGYNPPPCSFTGFYNKKNKELLCVMQMTLFTESTILVHVFLQSKLHHSGVLRRISNMYSWYINRHIPSVKKVMIISPAPCHHVHSAVIGLGFKQEGNLSKSIVWREKLEDVFIFGRALMHDSK